MIDILIADDQEEIRGAFRLILESQPDLRVVAEAGDGGAAVELARRHRPDVVLADIRMPVLDGLEVTRALAGPGVADPVRVVVVTTFDLDEYVDAALRNGACGFLLKRSTPALLVEAVRAAVAGDALISPQITVRLLRHLARPAPTRPAPAAPSAVSAPRVELTPRETGIVALIAAGRTNAEIAGELHLSHGTVKNYIAAIQTKLGTRNRVGIAAWAWDHGHATGQAP
ncbi:response regulator transcription factor [Actinomadura graeca]|uniref:Response regulator transcription factor n=1 Tax=Actinomadura graeca TaxID=2750812 RepID=A0ABX8QX38_9ACTN|nr:response regulator transcription factor [Actinomadura graeca]QXJ23371.1 response regulator transcription factor [Actinomadura graeca]